jgi:hypothetical protein
VELVIIGVLSLLAAGPTFYSGLGLGTILTPVFALFLPVPLAIAVTAIVHLASNVVKFFLTLKDADWKIAAKFGIPGAAAALLGAWLLVSFGSLPALLHYNLGGSEIEVTPTKAVIGLIIVAFAALELSPQFKKLEIEEKWLPLGGAISGFFGGLSGHQGALRSAFLIRAGMEKEAFIATGIVAAVIVDVSRLGTYGPGVIFK